MVILSPYDQAEQLARSMTAIVNLIFLAALGLPSLLLLIIGVILGRRNRRGRTSPWNRFNFCFAFLGFIVTGVFLILHLPRVLGLF